jgi:signal transduction histidine kinase/ActR/RegA family two-component response regulator
MRPLDIWGWIGDRVKITPAIAVGVAIALLGAAVGLGLYNEHLGRAEKVRHATTQAEILAASVAAPLAFDDATATREYINALRANPDVRAVGAYDAEGDLSAGYVTAGDPLPKHNVLASSKVEGGDLIVTSKVSQGSAELGSVYLRMTMESLPRRAMRYLGIAVIVVMASLLVAVLGASHASLSEAHRKLQQEIKEREKAEDALRQAQKMEAMGQLTGGVAHDFNNLLMVASSGLDLMDRTNDPIRRDRLKQGIRQAIDRGASLTQQLLAFARRSALHPEVVDLTVRLGGVRELLDRSLREDIVIDLSLAPDLWPVEVDPSQLEVAVLNVALNARDAMPSGGTITIWAENEPGASGGRDMVRLSISDTGVGVPSELLARVFEPFFTTKGVGQGTGLGLSQVYGFARSSGGDVKIDSEVGKGTTVSLLIPRSDKAVPIEAVVAPAPVADMPSRCRVLLVEDDDTVADLVGEMLAELGYDATRAPSALNALEALRREQAFDVVFSDMVMPGEMNGLDLAREIARRRPDLPIVLTTGYSTAAAAAAAEGIRLLVKPYRIEALAAELQAALTGPPAGARAH